MMMLGLVQHNAPKCWTHGKDRTQSKAKSVKGDRSTFFHGRAFKIINRLEDYFIGIVQNMTEWIKYVVKSISFQTFFVFKIVIDC